MIALIKKYDDKTLVLQAERALANDPSIDNSTISVASRHGVITLTGNARTQVERRHAVDVIARAYKRLNLKYDRIDDKMSER